MNLVFFTGNVGKDGEVRTVSGTDVLNFNVAVRNGSRRDAGTEWFRVAVWGARANQLKQYITKGAKVAVSGEFEIGSYEGKPQYNVRAHEVDPFCGGKREESGQSFGDQRNTAHDAELDDDAPF